MVFLSVLRPEDHGYPCIFNEPYESVPIRGYLHQAGFEPIFESKPQKVRHHLQSTLPKAIETFGDTQQLILAIVWGDRDEFVPVVDYIGFSGLVGGPMNHQNPTIRSFVIRDGIYRPGTEFSCGDGAALLGRTEDTRRTYHNFATFVEKGFPPLEDRTVSA